MVANKNFNDLKEKNHSVVLTQGKRRRRIKAILGANFMSLRQRGGELEIITKDVMPPGIKTSIERIWRNEE